ncbi:MAG: hypothetical protein HC923_05210 [Myxococcales bacterium]|nr:hypothetical protein [Myxococcales bacterium]
MAGQGMVTWNGAEIPFIYAKVSIETAVGGGALPGQNRSHLVVDAWFRSDHAEAKKTVAITADDRKLFFENALKPTKDAQGKLILTFSEGRDDTTVATYQLDWAWITNFSEFTPMNGSQVPAGMSGPGGDADGSYNQLVHVRWINVPEADHHKAEVA